MWRSGDGKNGRGDDEDKSGGSGEEEERTNRDTNSVANGMLTQAQVE